LALSRRSVLETVNVSQVMSLSSNTKSMLADMVASSQMASPGCTRKSYSRERRPASAREASIQEASELTVMGFSTPFSSKVAQMSSSSSQVSGTFSIPHSFK